MILGYLSNSVNLGNLNYFIISINSSNLVILVYLKL